nr:P17/29C-like protein DDB_G0287399 [Penaeus vannamei]
MPVQTDGPEDYKANYKTLKRKLKLLIYENECFQEELRKAQRALLRVRRDKSFLLDRLLQYHRGPDSSSDSEQTEESDTENDAKLDTKSCRKRLSLEGSGGGSNSSQGPLGKPPLKKKKSSSNSSSSSKSSKQGSKQIAAGSTITSSGSTSGSSSTSGQATTSASNIVTSNSSNNSISNVTNSGAMVRKLAGSNLPSGSSPAQGVCTSKMCMIVWGPSSLGIHLSTPTRRPGMGGSTGVAHTSDGQLSREEVERRLAARQPMNDFTTTVSLTLPNQLFSDNIMEGDFMEEEVETSPSYVEEDVTVDYD